MKKIIKGLGKLLVVLGFLYGLANVGTYFYFKYHFSQYEYLDVSNEKEFSPLIGLEYKTKTKLQVGKFQQAYVTPESFIYSIVSLDVRLHEGEYVGALQKESTLRLVRVVRCEICSGGKPQTAGIVEIISEDGYRDLPVYFNYKMFVNGQ